MRFAVAPADPTYADTEESAKLLLDKFVKDVWQFDTLRPFSHQRVSWSHLKDL